MVISIGIRLTDGNSQAMGTALLWLRRGGTGGVVEKGWTRKILPINTETCSQRGRAS